MSLYSENVIPGNHGKIFETNAETLKDLEEIKEAILEIEGIRDVLLNENIFPKEMTIHTKTLVKISEIEKAVRRIGFHAIPKTLFPL